MTELGRTPSHNDATTWGRLRHGVQGRLLCAFGAVAALTVLAGVIGWWSYTRVGESVQAVADDHVPRMTAALRVARNSAALSATAPVLASASSQAERRHALQRLENRAADIKANLRDLDPTAKRGRAVRRQVERLTNTIGTLNTAVKTRLRVSDDLDKAVRQVRERHREVVKALQPRAERARSALLEGASQASRVSSRELRTLVDSKLGRMRDLLILLADANRLMALLGLAQAAEFPAALNPIKKDLKTTARKLQTHLDAVPTGGDTRMIRVAADMLHKAAIGKNNVIALKTRALNGVDGAEGTLKQTLNSARRMHSTLLENVNRLADQAEQSFKTRARSIASGNADRIARLVNQEMARLDATLRIRAAANQIAGLLATAANVDTPSALTSLRQRFRETRNRLNTYVNKLNGGGKSNSIAGMVDQLTDLGTGEQNLFKLRQAQLRADSKAVATMSEARTAANALSDRVDAVVAANRAEVRRDVNAIGAAFDRGRLALMAVAGASLVIAAGIGFFYVNRNLCTRLQRLAQATRSVAWGQRHARIDVGGQDEIGEMAEALATFREGLDAKDRAEEANRAKSQFLATISHELRTPLNAVIGYSEMMANGVLGPLGNQKYAEYAEDIRRSGVHLRDLLQDLIDLSRIESGNYEPTMEVLDLSTVAHEASGMVSVRAQEKGLRYTVKASESVHIIADARAVRQILINLLSNAVKYTDSGGVRMDVQRTVGGACVRIADTGPGIPDELRGRLFEPFVQQDSRVRREDSDSTGLGLSLAYRLANALGAHLSIDSRRGVGTTVEVHFGIGDLRSAPDHRNANTDAPADSHAVADTTA